MSKARRSSSVDLWIAFARVLPNVVLATAFAAMALVIDDNGGRMVDWLGPALFAFLFGLSALIIFARALLRTPQAARARDPVLTSETAEPAFDADAAIKRYLASKEAGASETEGPAASRTVGFGRRKPPA